MFCGLQRVYGPSSEGFSVLLDSLVYNVSDALGEHPGKPHRYESISFVLILLQDCDMSLIWSGIVGAIPKQMVYLLFVQLIVHPLSNDSLDSQLLCDNHRHLLPNDQRSRVSVRRDVGRANRQVCDFQTFDAVDVQARVNDATSISRLHRASAELAQSKKTNDK